MSCVTEVGDSDFTAKVINASGYSLVDFWAPWCGPCVAFAPQLEKLAQQYAGELSVYKLNVQDNQDVPIKYGISAVPTFILFKGATESARIVGANLQQIVGAIDSALGKQA
ncbi:thioredoxin family protein [Candidatus Anaplasma sp. TIGMIC]|uniref:thioredoxin family protein n=1 Tax=Candidatus Anaplasma sp. TIGMIC TaxID=3020713 RepID=UPI00232E1FDC|nr:thioredoxin domain-containing protein [Candidatus Anaplasma sp. TIGMIC]MDB1135589.1 thioredoxin domain-containing protein [Candidatus Anaplasma sp. TIGMIC]